jgi:tetratricopeptide (TPR) repeat protein
MTTANRDTIICQRCGKDTDFKAEKCVACGQKSMIQGTFANHEADDGGEKAGSAAENRFFGEYETLKSQIEFLLQENRSYSNSISSMEKELVITKAGLETLLGEMHRKKLLKKSEFIGKWALQAKIDFKGLRLKELFARKKWDIMAGHSGKDQEKFEGLVKETESCFAALEWEKAYDSLRAAERISHVNYGLVNYLAQFAMEMERYAEAGKYVDKALCEKPVTMETVKIAALVSLYSEDMRGALKYADRWIKEGGECYEALLIKAFIKSAAGKWDEAQECSKQAIAQEEGLIPHLILAFSLMSQEKTQRARKVLEKASRFFPKSSEIKHMQHALCLLSGSKEEACSIKSGLEEAADINLCRKRERLLSANKIENVLDTVKPDIQMVMGDLSITRLTLL